MLKLVYKHINYPKFFWGDTPGFHYLGRGIPYPDSSPAIPNRGFLDLTLLASEYNLLMSIIQPSIPLPNYYSAVRSAEPIKIPNQIITNYIPKDLTSLPAQSWNHYNYLVAHHQLPPWFNLRHYHVHHSTPPPTTATTYNHHASTKTTCTTQHRSTPPHTTTQHHLITAINNDNAWTNIQGLNDI